MNWPTFAVELSLAQTTIYVGTATVALAQFREGRRARQSEAARALITRVFDPLFYRSVRFVFRELDARLRDADDPGTYGGAYWAELASVRGWDVDAERHPELVVLTRLEEIGTYVKYGHVAEDTLFDNLGDLVVSLWEQLTEVVRMTRAEHRDGHAWANAELLHDHARAWRDRARPRGASRRGAAPGDRDP